MLDIDNNAFFRLLCEQIGVALIATDQTLTIGLWNAAAARMFGAGAKQMTGTSITKIIPLERRALAEQLIHRAIQTGETSQFEFEYRDDRGAAREIAGTIGAIITDAGERIGATVCFRDITKRMALQEQVHENRKMVALGEMAGALSHHFNNILGGAITSIDFANCTDNPDTKTRVLKQVETALQRANTLTDGLLAFSAADHRSDESGDIAAMLEQVQTETQQQILDTPVELVSSFGELPHVSFSKRPVLTILRNIVQNAIEAMPEGGTIRMTASTDDKHIVVSISDTGCGLPAEARSRIFEPFWTTKGMLTAQSGKAIGLGLAVAHGLARMIGGTIEADSTAGAGSTFSVRLAVPP